MTYDATTCFRRLRQDAPLVNGGRWPSVLVREGHWGFVPQLLTYALVVYPASGQLVAFQPRAEFRFGGYRCTRGSDIFVATARRFLAAILDHYIDVIPGEEPEWARDARQMPVGLCVGNFRHRRRRCFESWWL